MGVLVTVSAFVLAACGDDDDSDDGADSGGTSSITLTQPAAFVETLPLYMAIEEGFFQEEGLEVGIKTVATAGGAHADAVLSGDAWGYIGGLEHVLFAQEKGGELVGLTNLNSPPTVYLVAGRDSNVSSGDAEALRDKTIATIQYGGTPNSVLRWYLDQIGLDPETDVKLSEGSVDAIFGSMGSGQAELATVFDPILDIGKSEGLWGDPIVDFAGDEGPGPIGYTMIGTSRSTAEDDTETVDKFLSALEKGRDAMFDDPQRASEVLAKRLDLPPPVAKSILDKDLAAGIFSEDGVISEDDLENAEEVVGVAGLYDGDVSYEDAVAEQGR